VRVVFKLRVETEVDGRRTGERVRDGLQHRYTNAAGDTEGTSAMIGDTCQKPGCDSEGSNTYRGPNGNTLRLCDRHYYYEVTRTEQTAGEFDPSEHIPAIPTPDAGPDNPDPIFEQVEPPYGDINLINTLNDWDDSTTTSEAVEDY